MNLRRSVHRDEPEINFIPLIDVLLVILIFLMITTTYQRVAELSITLPEAEADQAKQRPREINVGIDAQGRYVIDRTVFNFTSVPALADMLRKSAGGAKDPVVIVNADANATHQSVIHVMEAARAAGLLHITFATQSPVAGGATPAKK
jgi:biopolymer transport protein ExbD